MAIPELAHLDAVRKLNGDALVTYPGDDKTKRRIERFFGQERGAQPVDYLTPDLEYETAVLTSQVIVGGTINTVGVVRTWEDLPGPWAYGTRWDRDRGAVRTRSRAVVYTGQLETRTATSRKSYNSRNGSSIIAIETEELFSSGDGSAGNPVFPTNAEDRWDNTRGPYHVATQLVASTGTEEGSLDRVGDIVTKIEFQFVDEFFRRKVTETWELPGPVEVVSDEKEISGRVRKVRQLVSSPDPVDVPTYGYDVGSDFLWKKQLSGFDSVSQIQTDTLYYDGDHVDEATAHEESRNEAVKFPGYVISYGDSIITGFTVTGPDLYGEAVGARRPRSDQVPVKQLTWWLFSETRPNITIEEIFTDDVVINNVRYSDVVHDDLTRLYNGNTVTVPASSPSFTEYYGTASELDPFAPGTGALWIGEEKPNGLEIRTDEHPYRWRIRQSVVLFR